MPVTITQAAATVAIRAAADPNNIEPPVAAAIGALFPAAAELCDTYAPTAPDSILNAAAVRVLGWLWEAEPSGGGRPLTSSGAAQLLSQWRIHRAGAVGALAGEPTPTPTPGNNLPPFPQDGRRYFLGVENGELAWIAFPAPP